MPLNRYCVLHYYRTAFRPYQICALMSGGSNCAVTSMSFIVTRIAKVVNSTLSYGKTG